jgi:hypothetical protein
MELNKQGKTVVVVFFKECAPCAVCKVRRNKRTTENVWVPTPSVLLSSLIPTGKQTNKVRPYASLLKTSVQIRSGLN